MQYGFQGYAMFYAIEVKMILTQKHMMLDHIGRMMLDRILKKKKPTDRG